MSNSPLGSDPAVACDGGTRIAADRTARRRPTVRRAGIARWLLAGLVASTTIAGGAVLLGLAPEPDPVPRRWQLDIEPGSLRMATFDIPNIGPRRFFYMTYVVSNNSGQDLLFAPAFDMSSGSGEVVRSGRDVPLTVTQKLLEQAQNPFIQDQIGIIGELMQGQENAKHGLVIWPAANLRPAEIIVYVGGLSGETTTVTSPDGKQKFVLRKTLKLDFQSPGDLSTQGSQALPITSRGWIMR